MSLKNSNAVALERRMDLASFFCMIGRHGPAVALAVIAMVSVLAGFIIYRTVRGKRRKATTAAAADSDSKSPEPERDTSVIRSGQEPSPEESYSSVQSTGKRSTNNVMTGCFRLQVWGFINHHRIMRLQVMMNLPLSNIKTKHPSKVLRSI